MDQEQSIAKRHHVAEMNCVIISERNLIAGNGSYNSFLVSHRNNETSL